jgi:hypothetical protein
MSKTLGVGGKKKKKKKGGCASLGVGGVHWWVRVCELAWASALLNTLQSGTAG